MNKKFILFVVEGPNDKKEIEAILHTPFFSHYLGQYEPFFLPLRGDITSDSRNSANNIQKVLSDAVLNFRKNGVPFRGIKVNEIQEIVHIVDLDGAFIPRDCIVRSDNADFVYDNDHIYTSNIDGALGRNRKKAEIINKLLEVQQIGNVPYSIYYVACNMDHLLFDNQNLRPTEKRCYADQFRIKCSENHLILNDSIFKHGIMAEGSYQDSWISIREGTNSLRRKTNLNLFFSSDAKNPK